jgi:histone H3/H4
MPEKTKTMSDAMVSRAPVRRLERYAGDESPSLRRSRDSAMEKPHSGQRPEGARPRSS